MLFYAEWISLSEILDEQLLQPFDCWWMELLGNVSKRQHANRPGGQSLLRSSPLRSSAGEGARDARCWSQRDFSPLHAHFAPGWMADARQKKQVHQIWQDPSCLQSYANFAGLGIYSEQLSR